MPGEWVALFGLDGARFGGLVGVLAAGSGGIIDIDRFEPSSWLVVFTGVGALAAVLLDAVWRWSRSVVTIVHEGGHALIALVTGRRLMGIRLHSDTSGLTLSAGRPTGPGMVLTAAAGYVSPSLVGLAGVALLAADQVTVMLWGGAGLLMAMLVMVRNLFGALSLVLTGGAVVAVSLYTAPDVQAGFGYAMTWFLLIGAVRPVTELWRQRHLPEGRGSDAAQLARLTHLPGALWIAFFAVSSLAALGGGAVLLLT
ncbi:MAG TPA: M50 family metallopeptidase [Acidimicrobiales bacterium]|nr:M50 family metallopeptidase [Acidimicrobiales bacterium]